MARRPNRRAGRRKGHARLPASVWRPRKTITPEIKKKLELSRVIDKPEYIDGIIKWKGLDITIEEARAFSQALSRTPVSRGRFPTEADLIINAVFGDAPQGATEAELDPETLQQMQRWKDNYLKALNNLITYADEEAQDAYDDLYWKIAEMDVREFAQAMYEHDEELSVVFEYQDSSQSAWAERITSIWAKYTE